MLKKSVEGDVCSFWQFLSVTHRHTLTPTPFTHKLCIARQLCTAPTKVLTFHSSNLSSSNLLWEIRPPVETNCAKMLFMTEELAEAQSCQFLQVIAYACGLYAVFFTPIFLTWLYTWHKLHYHYSIYVCGNYKAANTHVSQPWEIKQNKLTGKCSFSLLFLPILSTWALF